MSKPKAVVLLVSGSFTSADLLLPLDRLRIREESAYVMLDDPKLADPQSGCEHLNIDQARVTTAASVLSGEDYEGYDLLFIPGASNITTLNMEFVARVIQTIYSKNMTVIATGTGRLLLAASGLLKDRVASSKSLDLDRQYIGCGTPRPR
ncbi:hypothetical protein DAEQUDRAFT_324036 [Daedalea quercina L-15889]|uniref:Uncharacterized protein n=1 Tax=Daedalea quercina L-15889 TaxID=1314783 RepID=A0A165PT65_9APHY|nr:hypothetical protein DAEQUDRAFT_324036 [Daedalea quercina L-15889]